MAIVDQDFPEWPMRVFDFNHAIVREPGRSVIDGLRPDDSVAVSFDTVVHQYRAYVDALRDVGLQVDVLPPIEAYPDSVFVEDPAIVFPEGAILMRPGAPSRQGEVREIESALARHFSRILRLNDDEHVDGGDVLVTPSAVFVGLSARTTRRGAEALRDRLRELGRETRIVEAPKTVLHLKSASALLDDETVIATHALASTGIFGGFDVIESAAGEDAVTNLVRINDVLFVDDRFPRTIDVLERRGYRLKPLSVGEVAKLDAGLSCMSLRWHS
jgi:dimethylargininase